MKTQDRVSVGIIGVGGIAHGQHIPGYLRTPGVEITALCDINEAALARAAEVCNVPRSRWTDDYEAMLGWDDLDAVSICTSNDLHYPVAMAAIAQGKHVFCEKPLGLNYQQTKEMYEAAEAAGVKHGVGFTHRCTPASRLAHQLISQGKLGDIYHVMAVYSYGGGSSFANSPMSWRRDAQKAGAGLLFDLGAHMVDMTRWWLGEEIQRVACHTRIVVDKRRIRGTDDWADVTTDDAACFIADFAGGAMGTFVHSSLFTARGFDQRIEVYGSGGALLYDQAKPYELRAVVGEEMVDLYALRGVEKEEPYPVVPVPGDLRDRWAPETGCRQTLTPDLIDAIRGGGEFLPTFEDGMRVQAVLDAALASSRGGGWVAVPAD